MPTFINVTNHELTAEQINDAPNTFPDFDSPEVEYINFVELPKDLKKTWSCVPTQNQDSNRTIFNDIAKKITDFIIDKASKDESYTTVLIQGDLGMVLECLKLIKEWDVDYKIACYYATTERQSVEQINENGEIIKTSVFKHAGYRLLCI